jgi:hypothetical protein
MGVVNVEGLGPVEIEGDEPTRKELLTIKRAIETFGTETTPPPINEPMYAESEEAGEKEDKSGLLRAGLAGASKTARGFLLETGLAVAEGILPESDDPFLGVVSLPEGGIKESPAFKLNKAWEEWEQDYYQPSVSIDDVLDDWSNAPAFVAETGVNSIPGMVAAVQSMPRYAASLVGDMAFKRAENRGDGKGVTPADLAISILASTGVAAGERVGARLAAGATPGATAIGRIGRAAGGEAATEAAQELVQTVGEQALTRDSGVLGVDPADAMKRAVAGAIVGAPLGGTIRGAKEAGIKLSDRSVTDAMVGDLLGGDFQDIPATESEAQPMPESVEAEAVDIREGSASLAEEMEEAASATQPVTPEPPPAAPRVVGKDSERSQRRPVEAGPEPTASQNAFETLRAIVDPEVTDSQLHRAILKTVASVRGERARASLQEGQMAARHAELDPLIEEYGNSLGLSDEQIESFTSHEVRGFNSIIRDMKATGLAPSTDQEGRVSVPAKLNELAQMINEGSHVPSDIEQAALHSAVMLYRKARREVLDATASAETEADIRKLNNRLNTIENSALPLAVALRHGGTELGRAMRYRQFVVNEAMDLISAQAAATLKKGRELTQGEKNKVARLWNEADAIENKGISERKRAQKSLKSANTQAEADAAKEDVVKADRKIRQGQRKKAQAAEETVGPWLAMYRKVFGASLVLNSSGDNSALGRQAIGLALQSPTAALKTLPVALRVSPFSKTGSAYAKEVQQKLLSSTMQQLRDLAGLELTEIEGLSNISGGPMQPREEIFMFRALESGMLGDKLVMPSQNAFGITLNLLRAKNFDAGARMLAEAHGVKDPSNAQEIAQKVPRADLEALALFINASTGRGKWISGHGFIPNIMRHTMFAPRFTLSRIETPFRLMQFLLKKGPFENVSNEARGVMAKRISRNLGFAMSLGVMSMVLGGEDWKENIDNFFNPESSDFLKLRVGDWHIDLLGGIPTTMRYIIPLAFTPTSAISGNWDEVLQWKDQSGRHLTRMLQNKLAPLTSTMLTMFSGKDYRGRDISDDVDGAWAVLLHRFVFPSMKMVTPISVENTAIEAWEDMTQEQKTTLQRLGPIALDLVGVGTQHYDPNKGRDTKRKSFRSRAKSIRSRARRLQKRRLSR